MNLAVWADASEVLEMVLLKCYTEIVHIALKIK